MNTDIDNEGQRAVPRPRIPQRDTLRKCPVCTEYHKEPFCAQPQVTKDTEEVIIHRTDLDSAVAALEVLDAMQSKYLGPTHKARLETERLIKTLKGN